MKNNNLGGIMRNVMRMMGQTSPTEFLNAYVQQNHIPQSVLNQAQNMARNAAPQVMGMVKN